MKLGKLYEMPITAEQQLQGLLQRLGRMLDHELNEIEESLSIADPVTRERFIRGRIENIRRALLTEKEKLP